MIGPAALLIAVSLVVPMSDDRDDVPDPSPQQLQNSITHYRLKGSVERLVETNGTSIVVGSDVLFAYASSDLDEGARAAVGGVLETLPQGGRVSVEGHTDSRGGDAVNMPLSQARAQAVADLLATARPDLSLTVAGFGSTRPIADEFSGGTPDYEAMAKNRRVELTVQP